MRSMLLMAALLTSGRVFTADLAPTNAGRLVPAGVVVVTKDGQWLAEVTVTNTFPASVDCRVYAVPTTNWGGISTGPVHVAWSTILAGELGGRPWIYPPFMPQRYGIGQRVEIAGSQKATLFLGRDFGGLSPTNENVLVIQYLPPGVKERALTNWSQYRILTTQIGKVQRAEPNAPPKAAPPHR